ncbi:Cytochrome c biogenesis protein CcdA [Amycolatopsis marina]|uniref:Cytochrome c biogenesis protein CcdA n=1 Tax=Amycolatopsis marina TaxID=490629 RepID=A0A1I1BCY0_9PSEU|nr:cytochrome c biogenesis CcdA family protein [Amycolatopsis marina]SFB47496.1 Cytochrome c biogenesis protein CcdA [Amycolatopsis marina]
MDVETLGFALAAGMVASVNPCGFAMLPAYLTLVVTGTTETTGTSKATAVGRALVATAVMATGFLVVFGAFGLVVAPLASSVQEYLPAVTVVIGVAMLALGAWMLAGREITLLLPKPSKGAPTGRLGSMFGYGFAYAIASLSCTVGPFLAVTSTTFRGGSPLEGVVAYLAYGAGMALVVGVLAVAVALAGSAATRSTRRILPYVNRIGGALLVLAGLYVGYYGAYELRLFHGGGSADDPVVNAAGEIQSVLAAWVDGIGAVPLLIALAALVLLGLGINRRRSRKRKAERVS